MSIRRKKVVVLGSTGSIGINALKVISRFSDSFEILGLAAKTNWRLLSRQIKAFAPKYAAIHPDYAGDLRGEISGGTKILTSENDLSFLASLPQADIVVLALTGRSALEPFLSAARAGKHIAPANKEALVIAGDLIMGVAAKSGARIIPIDSEQSAIFQCLEGKDRRELDKIYLTASGGPLYNVPRTGFDVLTVKDILRHPRWKMGKKITVDSATMMNKGFEVIEAQKLFGVGTETVEVVIHPQAIIHSMVGFRDGSVLAQLGVTDMRLPIQYALTYPNRQDSGLRRLDFAKLGHLDFAKPDYNKFSCLALAITAAKEGGTVPAVLNAADEVAVEAFLQGKIKFPGIARIVESVVRRHKRNSGKTLSEIIEADIWAREKAGDLVGKLKS